MKNITILGSTGSIGTQALEIIEKDEQLNVIGLTCNKNIALLKEQINRFNPKYVCVMDEDQAMALKKQVKNKTVEVLTTMDGLVTVASTKENDILLTAVVGSIGLLPTYKAIENNITIALANKETLVTAGEIIMAKAKEKNVKILPVDSEHSAIFQSMQGEQKDTIEKIILTASGGPFFKKDIEEFKNITLEDALNHPNWDMGNKITIDSATMMNKGLEVIEAKWLFDLEIDAIDVLIHPQSIIHSMVQFHDSSIIAQLGLPDMKLPIAYALDYPKRKYRDFKRLDLSEITKLTFYKPDEKFKCLQLAYQALKTGGSMPTVLNTANEIYVNKFLNREIDFLDIPKNIEKVMNNHDVIKQPTLNEILALDQDLRKQIK